MKKNRKDKAPRSGYCLAIGMRRVAAVLVIAGLSFGCSNLVTPPEGAIEGNIKIHLDFSGQDLSGGVGRDNPPRASFAQPTVDSVAVRVFRPGTGAVLEVAKGVGFNGSTTEVDVTVTCRAEDHKKVSIELFERGVMTYFGVDEDVNVAQDANTDVLIDAWDVYIDDFALSPVLLASGEDVELSWSGVRVASTFNVQESRTADFNNIIWETITPDTVLVLSRGLGTHYFRVAPVNQYVTGSFSPALFCYVASGSELPPEVTGMTPPEVLPGGLVTLSGTNLDLPGTAVFLADKQCTVISAEEDEMVIRVPVTAHTNFLFVWSIFGSFYTTDLLTVQRIAYVTAATSGSEVDGYKALITADPTIIRWSGVAVVPVGDLDWRNMGIFDLIVVGGDTGGGAGEWGGDESRAQAIAGSGAQVLAIGGGGAAYLRLVSSEMSGLVASLSQDTEIYIPDGSLSIFNAPYLLAPPGPSQMVICNSPENMVSFYVDGAVKPATMTLYADLLQSPRYYVLLDFTEGVAADTRRSFFWGYAGHPANLTPEANGCFLNVVDLLMHSKDAVPAQIFKNF